MVWEKFKRPTMSANANDAHSGCVEENARSHQLAVALLQRRHDSSHGQPMETLPQLRRRCPSLTSRSDAAAP